MPTMTYSQTLVTTSCWCGIPFAIPENLYDWMRKSDENGCKCPNGHNMVFGNSLEEQLEEQKRRTNQAIQREAATKALLRHEERSHAATRGHLTRKQKQLGRVKAGVCPCCNRTFQNLARHMSNQHPEYAP
jgi:hypothetical protein